jgi:hypothetical protein
MRPKNVDLGYEKEHCAASGLVASVLSMHLNYYGSAPIEIEGGVRRRRRFF